MKDYINHQLNDRTQTGANQMTNQMTNQNNQIQGSTVTLSVLISEAVYKVVVGVERLISLFRK